MPEETATPPPSVPITIYVPPAVRKYVLVRLSDPEQLFFDPYSKRLWEALEKVLRGRRLVAVQPEPVRDDRPRQCVVLHVLPNQNGNAEIHWSWHRYVSGTLVRAYKQEMRDWVDWYHLHLGMKRMQALEHFRKRYAINEEDHRLEAAYRNLYYKKNRKRKRTKVKR